MRRTFMFASNNYFFAVQHVCLKSTRQILSEHSRAATKRDFVYTPCIEQLSGRVDTIGNPLGACYGDRIVRSKLHVCVQEVVGDACRSSRKTL